MEIENLKIMNEKLIHENKSLKDDILIYKDDLKRLRDKIEKLQDENSTLKEKNTELENFNKEHKKFSKDGSLAVQELLNLLKESKKYTIYNPLENFENHQVYDIFSGRLVLIINDCYDSNLYPGLLLTPRFSLIKDMKNIYNYNVVTKDWEIYNHNSQKKYDFSDKKYKDILDIFEKICE